LKTDQRILVVSTVALGVALLPLPYAYYMLLRVGICGVFAYLAYTASQSNKQGLAWVLGITAVIYNPFAPLHLGREVWTMINLATIGLLFYVRSLSHDRQLSDD
tara:strand:- start:34 stop:345 length:312 start_codon:yes stop_codon:yes gene_type:complete